MNAQQNRPRRAADRRTALGRRGEEIAAEHLAAQGFEILERNWRCRFGELDIIAADGGDVVFVEVKTRSGTLMANVAEAVTMNKLTRMRRLAQLWLADSERRWHGIRFDVVGVHVTDEEHHLQHLVGVF